VIRTLYSAQPYCSFHHCRPISYQLPSSTERSGLLRLSRPPPRGFLMPWSANADAICRSELPWSASAFTTGPTSAANASAFAVRTSAAFFVSGGGARSTKALIVVVLHEMPYEDGAKLAGVAVGTMKSRAGTEPVRYSGRGFWATTRKRAPSQTRRQARGGLEGGSCCLPRLSGARRLRCRVSRRAGGQRAPPDD
jgi:hypothetical protein